MFDVLILVDNKTGLHQLGCGSAKPPVHERFWKWALTIGVSVVLFLQMCWCQPPYNDITMKSKLNFQAILEQPKTIGVSVFPLSASL
jgi:hypothetical protein